MSGELWAEMSAKEDAKVKALKLKYKQRMTEAKVRYVVNIEIQRMHEENVVHYSKRTNTALRVSVCS